MRVIYRVASRRQLELSLKLSAWRDDVDIADARRLLEEMLQELSGSRAEIWQAVEPYLFQAMN